MLLPADKLCYLRDVGVKEELSSLCGVQIHIPWSGKKHLWAKTANKDFLYKIICGPLPPNSLGLTVVTNITECDLSSFFKKPLNVDAASSHKDK